MNVLTQVSGNTKCVPDAEVMEQKGRDVDLPVLHSVIASSDFGTFFNVLLCILPFRVSKI